MEIYNEDGKGCIALSELNRGDLFLNPDDSDNTMIYMVTNNPNNSAKEIWVVDLSYGVLKFFSPCVDVILMEGELKVTKN